MNKTFSIMLGASILVHVGVMQISSFTPSLKSNVYQAPNTVEVQIIKVQKPEIVEPVIEPIKEVVPEIVEEVIAIEEPIEVEPVVQEFEPVIEEIQPEVIKESIVEIVEEVIPEPVQEIVQEMIEEVVEEIIEDELPPEVQVSQASQGAVTEAKPMDIVNPAPVYPNIARKKGWQGKVELSVLIGSEGDIKDIYVFKSSGHRILDKAALKTVKTWQFQPASQGLLKFESRIIVPVDFVLTY